MPAIYLEPVVGATGYPAQPQISASGAFEPTQHWYRGATNADVFISYDGKNDAMRVPAGAPNILCPAYFKSVFIRSANGVTCIPGVGLQTQQ